MNSIDARSRTLTSSNAAEDSYASRLTSGSRLARNSAFNLVGQGIPLVAAAVSIPHLVAGLGTDRFGLLTVVWLIIGYFSLFDLGLSRALTQIVAERLGEQYSAKAPPVVWPALLAMFVLGLFGTVVVASITPWLVHSGLKVPVELQRETVLSLYVLAAAIPVVVVTTGFIGVLSAFQRFGVLNLLRVPMGLYTFLAPLVVVQFSPSLFVVTAVLAVGRLVACIAHAGVAWRLLPSYKGTMRPGDLRPLFQLGAWMTVSNVVGPLMIYLDRFVIGAVLSMAAVAYYATPYEMITRLLIVPAAMIGTLFPAFAASHRSNYERFARLFVRGVKYTAILLFPAILAVVALAPEGLRLWLGSDFARESTPVLRYLAIGVFINAVAQVFATLVQAVGRADLTAKLHLLELPLYLSVLWWATHRFGIVGAAAVWTGRVTLDAALLLGICARLVGVGARASLTALALCCTVVLLTIPAFVGPFQARMLMLTAIVGVALPTAWLIVFTEDERQFVMSRVLRR